MQIKLWQRLFLINAGLIVLASAALVWAQQQSFRHGLLDYLNGLDHARATQLAERIVAIYQRAGNSFEPLIRRPGMLRGLVIELSAPAQVDGRPPPRPEDFREPFERPAPMEQRLDDRPAPPPGNSPPPQRNGPLDFLARLLIVDGAGAIVAGNARVLQAPALTRIPLQVAGQTVGEVLLAALPQLSTEAEQRFARDQLVTAIWTVLLVLVLAIAAALLLARRLLVPLKSVSLAAQQLAEGQHAARATVTRPDEIGQLAADFNRLAETLDRNRQSRQRWIADISHELRTPLAVLIGEMQALEDGVRTLDQKALASLQSEAGRIRQLVDDLYQLALADAGALEYRFEILDVRELLDEVLGLHALAFANAGLQLSSELGSSAAWVKADGRRLRQLLANVLGNTLRYTERGGRARVGLNRYTSFWQISVEDSAPGVPDVALPHLFERLFRVEGSRSREAGGAGLGLAIVREIVLAHGGHIEAGHATLGGLRLSIFLPQASAPA